MVEVLMTVERMAALLVDLLGRGKVEGSSGVSVMQRKRDSGRADAFVDRERKALPNRKAGQLCGG